MSIAAKHMDPIVGVDIHIILIPTPAGPVPTPLPNPFVGMVLDPFDYIPFIGATVKINGLPRGQAGTGGVALPPHLPLGGPFGPPPPGNEAEIFMGSATVASDGDAQSFLGMPALTCQSIGMPAPPRMKGQPAKSLVLPTSVVLSIPMGMLVLIGGPPTISLMALGMRAIMALAGPLAALLRRAQRGTGRIGRAMRAATARARRAGNALADFLRLGPRGRARVNRAICFVTGHPVDIATGKVFTDKVDLELAGPMPFKWERVWYSTSTYDGPMGHGWHHSYDAGLYVTDEVVLYRTPDGRLVDFPPLKEGAEHFDRTERLTLIRTPGKYDGEYTVRTIDRVTYRFRELRKSARVHPSRPRDDRFDPREHVLTGIHDASGQGTTFGYDESGRLTDIIDSCGRLMQLSYDRHGRIAALTAPHPDEEDQRFIVMQYAYDGAGNLVQTIDALGQPATYGYDRHLLSKETDRNGLSFYFKYDRHDEHAKCLRTWGDGGIYDHKLSYDEEQGLTVVENSLGYKTQYFHDGALVTKMVDARGGVTEYEYNEHFQKVKETDPVGGVTTWTYDGRGNLATATGPDGATLVLERDERDRLSKATDAMGGEWLWSHDERGRLTERKDPTGATTTIQHQGARVGAVVDALGQVFGFSHDTRGLLVGVHAPNGGTSAWQYDRLGRIVRATDANGNTQTRHFDLLNRITKTEGADGSVRNLSFDAEGHITEFQDDRCRVQLTYQGLGKLATRTEAGTVVRFEYDTEERLVGVINQHGARYHLERDANGDICLERGFDGVTRCYDRDAKGRIERIHRPNGIETRHEYDKGHRITKIAHTRRASGVEEQLGTVRLAYRKDGHIREADNGQCKVKLEFDACGRVTKELQGKFWVASEHDALGRRRRIQSSAGADITIERDAVGDPERIACGAFETRIQRDLLGYPLDVLLPGGVRAQWQRDSLGRPLRHDVHVRDVQHRARSYQWAPLFELTMVVDAMRGPTRYEHDALGNLASATYQDATEQRVCDAVGNIFERRDRSDRRYGAAGQLVEGHDALAGTTHYAYDAEGNLSEKHQDSHGTWRYRWTGDGSLAAADRPDGTSVTFRYDAFGRRISKHYRGRTTHWVWDGNNPLHEWVDGSLDPSGLPGEAADDHALEAHLSRPAAVAGTEVDPITWIFEPETFRPIAKLAAATESIVTDHIGAPVLMLDDTGSRTWSAEVSIYGDAREVEGSRFACPFRWPGQYEDAETGLYYNRSRYYDPLAGQYTSQDPIRLHSREYNFYRYVRDPLEQYDPLGIDWNYHLTDSSGNTYYHGRASDNQTMSDVARRHGANEGTDGVRFGEGDTMNQITPVGTDPNTVRGIEQRGIEENTLLGRNSDQVRGNRINGISEAKQATPTGQARLRAADDLLDGRKPSEMPSLAALEGRVCK